MLSAAAYSFRQKSRLAISLSWVAGYTNVIAFLVCGEVTSHATGNVTHFGEQVTQGSYRQAAFYGFLLLAFFLGAVTSGIMTESARRRGMASKYILPIVAQVVLLCLFGWGLVNHIDVGPTETFTLYWMTGVASFAMGLQNATVTKVSGAVVRTTHLTGVVTDLGLEVVHLAFWYIDRLRWHRLGRAQRVGRMLRLSRRNTDVLRLALLASILGSFLFGTVAGTWVFMHWPHHALAAPIAFLCWIIFIDWRKPIADVRELDPLSDPDISLLGNVKEWLPPGLGMYRLSHHKAEAMHHAPDFQLWVDRLPAGWRAVILMISPLTRIDEDAALDLCEALRKLRLSHRELIVCGLTQPQFRKLDAMGVIDILKLENVCADLEFAIARGINALEELQAANHF